MRACTQFIPDHWALLTKMTENMTSIPDDSTKEGIVSTLSQSIDLCPLVNSVSSAIMSALIAHCW